jgi:hypothetical protein
MQDEQSGEARDLLQVDVIDDWADNAFGDGGLCDHRVVDVAQVYEVISRK